MSQFEFLGANAALTVAHRTYYQTLFVTRSATNLPWLPHVYSLREPSPQFGAEHQGQNSQ